MEWLLSLLFFRAGAVLASALGVLGLWVRTAWLRRRAEKLEARARTAEAQVEIQKVEIEYAPMVCGDSAVGSRDRVLRI